MNIRLKSIGMMESTNNCWIMDGKCLYDKPEGFVGYIYHIQDDQNRHYWGKKLFEFSKKKILSKKARKESGTRKRIERSKIQSDWLDYWSSSKELLEYIAMANPNKLGFKREIIKLCKNKESLSYWETAILIQNNALFREDCYNGNINGKWFKGKIHE